MILNRENLNALSRSFRALVLEGRETYRPLYPRIAAEVPSDAKANYYAWLASLPRVRQWVGEREIQNLSAQTYAIENADFEMTVEVARSDIEDDQIGVYSPLFRQLGIEASKHDDELVFQLLIKGFTQTGYDGKPFFATNHQIGKKTYSNRGDGKLNRERFRAALAQMRSLTAPNGSPLGFFYGSPILLVVGPALYSTALDIVGVQQLAGGGSNPDYQAAEILLAPWLVNEAEPYWFLIDASQAIKPFVLQRRREPEWVVKDDPSTSDEVFKRNVNIYGLYERKAAGYLFWQLAYGSTGQTA